ncbi:MAG TPA: CBS domain-containing protein [Methylomirabilota bacterium]|jgi:CBS domain-containing protein
MTLRDILGIKGSQVHTIGPDQTVLEAVALLVEHRIGALLVQDGAGAVAGIISERDVLRQCQHHGAELGRLRVREVMTPDLIVCGLADDVEHAMGLVTKHRVRHLPVMDEGQVAGMISIGDLVKACLDEAQSENVMLKEYITGR